MIQFNVLWWDFNKPEPGSYDVLPYFRREYEKLKKSHRPKTKKDWIMFVSQRGMRMYWARAEYEIIVKQWPPTDKYKKVDIWQQIEPNIDLIVKLLMEEYETD